jgi:hypothetical protein
VKRNADPNARILSRWQITGSTSSIASMALNITHCSQLSGDSSRNRETFKQLCLDRCATELARQVLKNEFKRANQQCKLGRIKNSAESS